MSKIKALEMLRKTLADCVVETGNANKFGTYWITKEAADKLINEIESEIEEFYMPLPLDADGVPIRVGDIIQYSGHAGNVWLVGMNEFMCTDRVCYSMNECSHLKPRTLNDVLMDFASDYRNTMSMFDAGESTGLSPHELVDKYAEEIRGLMEG